MQQILLRPPSLVAALVVLTAASATSTRVSPSVPPATSSLGVYADGNVKRTINAGGASTLYAWKLSGLSSDYELLFTFVSGTVPSGTLGSWTSLASDSVISLSRSGSSVGTSSSVVSAQIRLASSGVVLAGPVNFTLTCNVI